MSLNIIIILVTTTSNVLLQPCRDYRESEMMEMQKIGTVKVETSKVLLLTFVFFRKIEI